MLYAGIFIDEAARAKLLSVAPASFDVVSADHVTPALSTRC